MNKQYTDKQLKFIAAIIAGETAKQSYISAGYAKKGASTAGPLLLKTPHIQSELTRRQSISGKYGVNKEYLINELQNNLSIARDNNNDIKTANECIKLMAQVEGIVGDKGNKAQPVVNIDLGGAIERLAGKAQAMGPIKHALPKAGGTPTLVDEPHGVNIYTPRNTSGSEPHKVSDTDNVIDMPPSDDKTVS